MYKYDKIKPILYMELVSQVLTKKAGLDDTDGSEELCKIASDYIVKATVKKNMQPVYDFARRQGYEVWNRINECSGTKTKLL